MPRCPSDSQRYTPDVSETGVDLQHYREIVGRFATGVTVVTTASREPSRTSGEAGDGARGGAAGSAGGEETGSRGTVAPGLPSALHPWGITVNAFAGLSLDPPLVLICIGQRRKIHPVIAAAGRFAVNILGEDGQGLSDCFAGAPSPDPPSAFCRAPYRMGVTGVPILEAAIAHLECTLERAIDAGDHTVFIGRVVDAGMHQEEQLPLLYFRRHYLRIERAATVDLLGIPDG